jgi:hypothetical protein
VTLFFILISAFIIYIFWTQSNNKKPIESQPIKIEPLSIREDTPPQSTIKESPSAILAKLKIAVNSAKEAVVPTKEKIQDELLDSLKSKIAQQETKKTLVKKEITKKIIQKKIVTKKEIVKKENKTQKNKLVSIKEKAIEKKIIPTVKVTKKEITQRAKISGLSREEEVASYNNQYFGKLEVVGVSENFEIEEEKQFPDSYYFEKEEPTKDDNKKNLPLKYVEKLGVVEISDSYEVNFTISD